MSKNSSNSTRPQAHVALNKFLQDNNIIFTIRRQQVRYIEDNSIIIEKPVIAAFYNDEVSEDLINDDNQSQESSIDIKKENK